MCLLSLGTEEVGELCKAIMQFPLFPPPHSLFPTMPRHNYWKVAPLVKSLCAKHGIEYHCKPLLTAFADIVQYVSTHCILWVNGMFNIRVNKQGTQRGVSFFLSLPRHPQYFFSIEKSCISLLPRLLLLLSSTQVVFLAFQSSSDHRHVTCFFFIFSKELQTTVTCL